MYFFEKYEEHPTLNQKIWSGDKLRPDIKEKLFDIIDRYLADSQILEKKDILAAHIVGSNAGYNYTDDSDLDLHLIVDMEKLSRDSRFAQLANDGEKSLFNKRYDLELNGVNVELYVEDVKSGIRSNGIYDLYANAWVKKPLKLNIAIDEEQYDNAYAAAKHQALELLDSGDIESLNTFLNDLYLKRRTSLAIEGEPGFDNQIFKDLRAEGILDDLKDRLNTLRSEELSLKESFIRFDSAQASFENFGVVLFEQNEPDLVAVSMQLHNLPRDCQVALAVKNNIEQDFRLKLNYIETELVQDYRLLYAASIEGTDLERKAGLSDMTIEKNLIGKRLYILVDDKPFAESIITY